MTHPLLAELYDSLDREAIGWLRLRPPSSPTGDVDLLVAAREAPAFRRVAEAHGFVALPGYAEAPNMILFRYDRCSDRWLVLDVATAIAFDHDRVELRGIAGAVLARRRREDEAWVPADTTRSGCWCCAACSTSARCRPTSRSGPAPWTR